MGDLGFWALAQEDPDHLALVAPDGTEITAGELLGRANQLVHGLRALGLEPGDAVATLLPNGAEIFELYLAALQAGWYLVPINHHLVAPEVAYILADSEAKVFVAHERFADVCVDAADEAECRRSACLAVGDIAGFGSYAALRDAQPTDRPEDRTVGDVMNYTSGTTGNPKGVRRPLAGRHPRSRPPWACRASSSCSASSPRTTTSTSWARRCTTRRCMRFAGALDPPRPHPGPHGQVDARGDARSSSSSHQVTTSHMVPTQFHRLLALPDDVRARYDLSSLRHMIHAAAPCPVDVKHRMIEWWGPVDRRVLRGQRGRRHGGHRRGVAEKPGTVGGPGRSRRSPSSTTTASGSRARRHRHRLHVHADRRLRVPQGQGEDRRATASASSSPWATSATSTRTATCSSATARST